MSVKYLLQRVLKSRAYDRSKALARDYLMHPDRVSDLIARAEQKSSSTTQSSALAECRASLATGCRLIKAYATGQYKEIPWESLTLIAASLLYFIMPLDFVPDILFALGFIDDAALLAWTFKALKGDVDRFAAWEREQTERPTAPSSE